MSTDLWTCGMELRPTYGFVSQAGNQQLEAQQAAMEDAERRMAEAKHMVAEAMRVLNGGV